MTVRDRVGFACCFLSDTHLSEYIEHLNRQLTKEGNLDGMLLTGKFRTSIFSNIKLRVKTMSLHPQGCQVTGWICFKVMWTKQVIFKQSVSSVYMPPTLRWVKTAGCSNGSTATDLCWTVGGCGRNVRNLTFNSSKAIPMEPKNLHSKSMFLVTTVAKEFQCSLELKESFTLWVETAQMSNQRYDTWFVTLQLKLIFNYIS